MGILKIERAIKIEEWIETIYNMIRTDIFYSHEHSKMVNNGIESFEI